MLWSEKCSNMCYGLHVSSGSSIGLFSSMTTVWLQNDDSQFHTAYACVEFLMKLAILFQCKFLILVSRLMVNSVNFLRLPVFFLCIYSPKYYNIYGPQSYAQRLGEYYVIVLCPCEHLGILTVIQNYSSQLGVER